MPKTALHVINEETRPEELLIEMERIFKDLSMGN